MIYMINTVKAIILKDQSVLMIKKAYENNRFVYTLPGGTQESGENLEETLIREVEEEVAAAVNIIRLLHVYEHRRKSRTEPGAMKHKIEFAFLCELAGSYEPQLGLLPDANQVATEWVGIDKLAQLNLYPHVLLEVLSVLPLESNPHYMGFGVQSE
ncbi:MAG: NUDIX domain-containing protein [Hahellaceae bacterium]|nr:NUDIX domain-containing protein [Hahellaceae bacterium]MCP5210730.1 NUDIX domain-containing protein [Hahellaceae bacterium]